MIFDTWVTTGIQTDSHGNVATNTLLPLDLKHLSLYFVSSTFRTSTSEVYVTAAEQI